MKSNPQSSVQKNKLVIKPFKSKPKIPDDFESVSWVKLRECIRAVFQKTSIDISKEELYRVFI
jgi:cullin 4